MASGGQWRDARPRANYSWLPAADEALVKNLHGGELLER